MQMRPFQAQRPRCPYTTVVLQDQEGSGAQWKISQVTSLRVGNDNVTLVPGLQYGLVVNGVTKFFSVAEPCAVSPTTLDYSGITFRVSCGALDSDEDGVPDETDNCPLDPNPDQLDLNLDGEGDVCDLDDDGDGFEDSVDNCPQVENTDQGDLDGDGVGDACDGDDDGDGVENDTDLCAFSPNGTLVDSDGCTGPQRIARLCERTRFIQHGQYVRCVAQAANDAAADGLITAREKALFVKEAAKDR